ncbi:MAG TPA: hypothetical protein DCE41_05790 [Cytophagales bacterium]|nr:hypothetical protein [Cytophagales bacterium]HAA24364.1 hypothetical protein [Cytophagales bacterium]HAP63418.1 hypothetical protein [Cytophagales bacterium]
MELLPFLKQTNLFSEEDCITIEDNFEREFFSKGASIPTTTKYSQHLFFIESGLLRTYFVQDGKNITHFFSDENYFIAPINSIFFNKTDRYEWEALEPCQIKSIPYPQFLALEERFPRLARVLLDFTIMMMDLFSQKLNLHQSQSAAERYEAFLTMYPNLINRVSLGSVASFLGISQQTLSVVRSQKK